MRGVRSLSGLAGPTASLKSAGGLVQAHADNPLVGAAYVAGNYSNTNRTIDFSNWGVQPGDLLIARLFSHAWFGNDSSGTHGKTEVLDVNWDEIYHAQNVMRCYARVVDVPVTHVTAKAISHGGMQLVALRGVRLPDVFNDNNRNVALMPTNSSGYGRAQTVAGFPGTPGIDFDMLLTFATSLSYGSPQTIYVNSTDLYPGEPHFVHNAESSWASAGTMLREGPNCASSWKFATAGDTFQGLRATHFGLFRK